MKNGAEEPSIFLGANIEKFQLADGRLVWSMTSIQYVNNAVKNVRGILAEEGRKLEGMKNKNTPLPYSYRPELDSTDWSVKVGRGIGQDRHCY